MEESVKDFFFGHAQAVGGAHAHRAASPCCAKHGMFWYTNLRPPTTAREPDARCVAPVPFHAFLRAACMILSNSRFVCALLTVYWYRAYSRDHTMLLQTPWSRGVHVWLKSVWLARAKKPGKSEFGVMRILCFGRKGT